jgi:hypothetical protein
MSSILLFLIIWDIILDLTFKVKDDGWKHKYMHYSYCWTQMVLAFLQI